MEALEDKGGFSSGGWTPQRNGVGVIETWNADTGVPTIVVFGWSGMFYWIVGVSLIIAPIGTAVWSPQIWLMISTLSNEYPMAKFKYILLFIFTSSTLRRGIYLETVISLQCH